LVYKQYPDLRDDCSEMMNFEAAGLTVRAKQYLILCMFTIAILLYTVISAADAGWSLSFGPFQYEVKVMQLPHIVCPLLYAVSLVIWILLMDVVMLKDFSASYGFWLSFVAIAFDFAAGVHFFWTKRQVALIQS
jgi:hypothetical protein